MAVAYPFQTENVIKIVTSLNTTTAIIAAANSSRRKIIIRNAGTRAIYIDYVTPTSDILAPLLLAAGAFLELQEPTPIYSGIFYAIRPNGGGAQDVITVDFSF